MNPKFSIVEIVLVGVICVIIDIVSMLADGLVVGVGGFFVQGISWLIFVFWFKIKGVEKEARFEKILKKIGIQLIPFIPTYTATFLYTAYKTNKEAKKAEAETASQETAEEPQLETAES